MATPASRTVSSSPNPSAQGSPRHRDWSSLKTSEPGSAFRGINRGRGGRGGGVRGGRGGSNSSQKGTNGSHPDTTNSTPSPSSNLSSVSRKPSAPSAPTSTTTTPNGLTEKDINGSTQRGGRPKSGPRKQPRNVPAVVVAPPSPSQSSRTAPPTPSRSTNRRRRSQKGSTTASKQLPPPAGIKAQRSRGGSTPASQMVMRKDIPPHLAAAHEAEIRHDIDALVERVRAVAMAENRPTSPGSHIDWAGDEDDSLPDLDDWGVTTTHTNATHDEILHDEISPILADALKPLPEPNSEVCDEGEEREMETYDDVEPSQAQKSLVEPSTASLPKGAKMAQSTSKTASEQCTVDSMAAPVSSSPTLFDGKHPLHPSLPPKPVAAMESLRARGRSVTKPPSLPPKSPVPDVEEESLMAKSEGLSESIHAPSTDERFTLERVSSASSSERGLTASIHAPVPGLPESQSAPSLLTSDSTPSVPRAHSRSQTEGRSGVPHPPTAPPGTGSHRRGRSGATSPLGKHVFTHARNHSTPAGGAASRPPQTSRPVITGDAISRLARTIGGLGPTSRTQTISVTKDSTLSSSNLTCTN